MHNRGVQHPQKQPRENTGGTHLCSLSSHPSDGTLQPATSKRTLLHARPSPQMSLQWYTVLYMEKVTIIPFCNSRFSENQQVYQEICRLIADCHNTLTVNCYRLMVSSFVLTYYQMMMSYGTWQKKVSELRVTYGYGYGRT